MAMTTIWLGTLGVFGSAGALLDILTRRLPNILCGLMVIAGLVLAAWIGGLSALGLHLAHAALALVVGYLLFVAGVFGGGDGKFYAAVAAFFPVAQMLSIFVLITVAGLVLAMGWFGLKRFARGGNKDKENFGKLPYGVAIAAGALAHALLVPP